LFHREGLETTNAGLHLAYPNQQKGFAGLDMPFADQQVQAIFTPARHIRAVTSPVAGPPQAVVMCGRSPSEMEATLISEGDGKTAILILAVFA